MFSDESQEVITLPSSWRVERSLVDAGCQTKDLKYAEISTQSIEKHEIEGQTEEDTKENENFSLLEDTSQALEKNLLALSNFLLRVYPDVCEQLIANNRSNAFDGYDVNWEDEFEAITCPFKLFHKEAEHKFEVTSISWNSRGSVIAVAWYDFSWYDLLIRNLRSLTIMTIISYGRNDHEGWCTHRSLLCSWNIDMRNINMEKADRSLDVECCLTSVAFHPEHPPLLAAGTFTGELIIWDLSQDDDNFITNSSHRDETHQEPITKVFWLPNTSLRSRRYKLVSASCDGKLFLWEFNQISKKLKLEKGFVLLTDSIPTTMRPGKLRRDSEMGVTCVSFSKFDADIFFVGTEGGNVFKCSMSATKRPSKDFTSDMELVSPVTLALQPHIGPVYSVDCSPHHRNILMSCGTDTTVNVRSALQVTHPSF
eukprot:gene5363-6034_t